MHITKQTLQTLSFSRIDTVTYPPHTTDELQGLDKVLFKPLKAAYEKDIRYRQKRRQPCNKNNLP